VTGAARGVGAALALELAQRGARLALVGLEPAELQATADACARVSEARTWVADVTDRARMYAVAREIGAHFGTVDIVVANAGIALIGMFADSDPVAFDRVIEVNLLGAATTARAFLPALLEARGYLLHITSFGVIAPAPLMAAYCASKAGVESFAHCLRTEVAHRGMGVGVAYLAWTDTDMMRGTADDEPLRALMRKLPWPANKTAPLAPAVARVTRGIIRRSHHIYAQRWVRLPGWLPRPLMPVLGGRLASLGVRQLEPSLFTTAHLRLELVGPGGRAAAKARQSKQVKS
jgi:NAD(P)-dependent dehydrogenase (short-subunit alcohol dehydrogenase family)